MEKLIHFWKQGWKFQLAMLIFHACVALLLVPVAYLVNFDKGGYYAVAVPLYVIVLVPVGGLLAWWLKPKLPTSANKQVENA